MLKEPDILINPEQVRRTNRFFAPMSGSTTTRTASSWLPRRAVFVRLAGELIVIQY